MSTPANDAASELKPTGSSPEAAARELRPVRAVSAPSAEGKAGPGPAGPAGGDPGKPGAGKPAAGKKPGAGRPGAGKKPGAVAGAGKKPAAARKPGAAGALGQVSAPPAFDEAARERARAAIEQARRQRVRRLALRFGLGVGLPTALAAVYFGAVASPRYTSSSLFSVHSAEGRQGVAVDSFLGALPLGSPTTKDTLAVRDYVLSRSVLERLDSDHGFIAHYRDSAVDPISRFAGDGSFEDAFEYYAGKIEVNFDATSGVLELEVQAFSPDAAQRFAAAVLEYSEQMVNQLSDRARADQTRFAEREVRRAEVRLAKARQQVLELQAEGAEFNPVETATTAMSVRAQLEAEVARAQAELSEASAVMQPGAPRVVALQQRVASLQAQVDKESRRLVHPTQEKGLNTSIVKFEAAALEKEFAQSAYQSALSSLELARIEASRQHRYLAVITPPSKPDAPAYPKPWLGTFTAFLLSFVVMGIGSLLTAAVREHARI